MRAAAKLSGRMPFVTRRRNRPARRRASAEGFTIVETMIVLAITGLLFVIAVLAVGGRQNEAEFQQAANDVQSQLQQTIGQVGSGDYQYNNNFTCSVGIGPLGTPAPSIQPGTSGQGQNTDCIFMGKAVQFGLNTNSSTMIVYPIAGLRANNGSLSQAAPTAIAPGQTTNNAAGFPDESQAEPLNYGLSARCIKYFSSATIPSPLCGATTGTNVGAVAFLNTLGTYSGSQLLSGSQQLNFYPVVATSVNQSSVSQVDKINDNLTISPANPAGGVQICFASGSTNQSALASIGTNHGSPTVAMTIKNGTVC
jgi:type II secretory pathway pseudopilin PulG